MICKNCGAAAPDKDAFCVNCGAALHGGEKACESAKERPAGPVEAGGPRARQDAGTGAEPGLSAGKAAQPAHGSSKEAQEEAARAGEERQGAAGTAARSGRKKKKIFRRRARQEAPPVPPEDLVPLTTGQALGILAAFCVPVLNWALMFRWAYGARGNESRRSLARAGLAFTGILLAAAIAALLAVIFVVRTGLVSVSGVI